jgi:hypothetical protein
VSDGWFYYYTFDLPSKHLLDLRGFPAFLGLSSFYFACFVSLLLSRKMRIKNNYYYIAMLASVAVLTSAAMINPLFDFNLFIPMVVVFAVIFGIGYDTVLSKKEELPVINGRNVFWKRNEFLYSVFIAQLVFMIYNPFKYIPTDADTKAGNELVNIISELPGRVYIPSHPYLCDMAGKEKFAHILPLHDLLELKREGFETDVEKQAKQVFREAVTSQYFDYIILDNSNRLGFLQKEIENYYYRKYLLFEHEENVFWTSTGAKRRPEYIYAKKESALQQ